MSKLVALFVFIVVLVPHVYSQTTADQKQEAPSIVTNADEVTLDLVVHNKKHKSVLDLKPEDIAVTDNGSVMHLSDLRLVTGQPETDRRITLLFDPFDPSAATNARSVARKILKLIPLKGFSFSVLTVRARLHLVQEFTSDRVAIEKAVNAATAVEAAEKDGDAALPEKELIAVARTGSRSSGIRVSANDRKVAQVTLASLEESQRIVQEQHSQPSLSGLLALARTERQFPGRKIIIYFTEGLQPDANTRDMIHLIGGAANRAGISIYVIDKTAIDTKVAEGMLQAMTGGGIAAYNRQNPPPTGPAAQKPVPFGPGLYSMVDNWTNRVETEGTNTGKDPLNELAANTGGAYLFSEDGLKKPFKQAVDDLTTYYEASYVPPTLEYDGKFHPVTVKAVRKGLNLRSRPGYFAVPPTTGIRPFEVPLMKVLAESQLPADLQFHAAVLRLGDLPTGNENAVVVEIPSGELQTHDDPNSSLYSMHGSIVAQIRNNAGEVIAHFSEDVPRHGSLDSNGKAQSDLVTMQRHFVADPGDYLLEAAILDRISGKASAQRLQFSIPSQAAGPSLSDVTLVQRMDPLPSELYEGEPLRYGSERVVPSLSSRVAHGAKDISFFFVVHPDPKSSEPARLEMEVLKNNETIAQVPLQLRKTDEGASVPYLASIQSGALPSGEYEVIERLSQAGNTTERAVTFRIDGAELASSTVPESSSANDATGAANSEAAGANDHRLVITSLPAGAVSAPSADELAAIIEGARKRALDYGKSLPNFICIEFTNRSVDLAGSGNWKYRDSLAELLTYKDNQESRSTLEVNGKRSSLTRAEMNSTWPMSSGEFGALLNLVFAPPSKTHFEWKEAAAVGDGSGTLQVLSFRVSSENATIALSQGNESVGVGFHGLVYIDGATSGIRRVTLEADGLPRTFPMHAASMTVDYDFVAISGRDYLMPVRSTVMLHRNRRQVELNEISFRNYRRFASRTRIKMIQ